MSNFERIPIVSREDWLKLRERDVTASVAGALLGVSEYMSAYGLYAEKAGLVPHNNADSSVKKRGRLLEPVAIELIKEKHPTWDVSCPAVYYRDPAIRLGATPDLLATDERKRRILIQIKTLAPVVLRKWRDEESGEFRPPLWIAVQTIVEAHLTEADEAFVAALIVGNDLDLQMVSVPIHAGILNRVRVATAKFWESIANKTPPGLDFTRDGEAIAQAWLGKETGEMIDLSEDNLLPELCAEHAKLSQEKTAAEKRIKAINAEIISKMGAATTARFQGGLITAKTINRAGYTVKPSSYRTPRIAFDAVEQEGEAA